MYRRTFAAPILITMIACLPAVGCKSNLDRAVELESRKDWKALIKHGLNWRKSKPEHAEAWNNLGVAYNKSGQTAKAIEAYQQALRIKPEDAEPWYGLRRCLRIVRSAQ